jgi:hypothetical protein
MIFLQTSATTFHQIDAGEVVYINTQLGLVRMADENAIVFALEFQAKMLAALIRANPMITKANWMIYLNREKVEKIEQSGYSYHASICGNKFDLDPNCLLVNLTFKKSYVPTTKQYIKNSDNQGIIDSIIEGPGTVEWKVKRIAKEDIGETVNTYYIGKRKRELKAKNK